MTIKEALAWGAARLAQGSAQEACSEARILLSHATGMDRLALITHPETTISNKAMEAYRGLLERRRRNEPVAYITGHREFWSLDLEVNKWTLIPRPETELLVELSMEALKGISGAWILELGTGSGAISIALLKEMREARIVATDICPRAMETARRNALRHRVAGRLLPCVGDWYSCLGAASFDLIVSNPPYVSSHAYNGLAGDVRLHEPAKALESGPSGLEALEVIITTAPAYLKEGGWLLCEIGWDQEEAAKKIALDTARLEDIEVARDLAGLPRALRARKPA